jgi:transposase
MRYAGIDIAAEMHVVAVLDEERQVVLKPTAFGEDTEGYGKLIGLLGAPADIFIAMEATGHYWKNLFAVLAAHGFAVALLNPLRTRRFAGEDLERTKTDAIDALGVARFAAEKRPAVTRMPDEATQELREVVRLRDRLVQDFGDQVRQLHRLVDLGFPELTRHVRDLSTELAQALLSRYPTAKAFAEVREGELANLCYDGRRHVGRALAQVLIAAAKTSVGQHHGEAYRIQVECACETLALLRKQLRRVERDIDTKLDAHEVGKLLTTIDGIGPTTAARIIAECGDPADFRNADALASYLGLVPSLRQSGKRVGMRAGLTNLGNVALRAKLWMPTLTAVRKNAWLRAFYERLRAAGKLPKVALCAAMRKLVTAIYSVAKHRRPFVPRLVAAEVKA